MALVLADRVQETTTTTGTGSYALGGAKTGFQAFSAVLSSSDTTYYTVTNGTDWEVGIGTFTSPSTLARTTVLSSSNGNDPVDWSAGSKDVFVTYPASKAAYYNAAGQVDIDNLRLDGNTLSSTNTNGNVVLDPNGTGSVDVSSAKIINVATPTTNNDAANKEYVDSIVAAGVHFHDPVRVEATSNLNATYNNGTAGVGATLTNAGTQAALVLDGVTLSVADRVLIYLQTDQTENGVYVVTDTGSVSTNWILTRASDADTYVVSSPDGLSEGSTFFVLEGTIGAGDIYSCNTAGVITFGTTNITFAQIGTAQIYTAGAGLDLTGVEFSVETNGITNAMLRQSAGLSVIGRSGNTTGDVADVTAGTDHQVLRRSGTSVSFGAVALNQSAAVSGTLSTANGGTGITSFGSGVGTFLGTPSSANLAAAVTDETGTGALVFANTPTLVSPVLGTPTSGNLSNCTADGTNSVGFKNIPVNSQSTAYTLILSDAGKTILHPIADNNARTFTIPANISVAYPIGTSVTFVNLINTVTIAITSDTMYLASDGTTGNRTLAAYGVATAIKVASTTWVISGNGLT